MTELDLTYTPEEDRTIETVRAWQAAPRPATYRHLQHEHDRPFGRVRLTLLVSISPEASYPAWSCEAPDMLLAYRRAAAWCESEEGRAA